MRFFTNSGKMIDMTCPEAGAICPEDIAHALSQLCRAAGHFKHFYSVGQHSLNCMSEAVARGYSIRVCMAALLHDASEAYLCDVPTPLKDKLEDYRAIEDTFQTEIWKRFSLYPLTEEEERLVKSVDEAMLYYEFKHLHTIPIHFEKTPVIMSAPKTDYMDMSAVKNMLLREIKALEKADMTA